jgi:hypothetical protein
MSAKFLRDFNIVREDFDAIANRLVEMFCLKRSFDDS